MTSPAGPQSHFLWRWMASSSRAGVFLSTSPGEVGSVRSSCSSPGVDVDVSFEDSFSAQFAPLPVSCASSCLSADIRAPDPTPPGAEEDTGHPAARNPQGLVERLRDVSRAGVSSQTPPEIETGDSELFVPLARPKTYQKPSSAVPSPRQDRTLERYPAVGFTKTSCRRLESVLQRFPHYKRLENVL